MRIAVGNSETWSFVVVVVSDNCGRESTATMVKNFKKGGHMDVIERIYNEIPAFTDIFTEESFYIFAILFSLSTILLAFILSRFITLKPIE